MSLDISDELTKTLARLTQEPGVYRMLNLAKEVLYVGKASNLKKRVSSYFNKQNKGAKNRSLVQQIAYIEVSVTRSEKEALLLESNLIKSFRPKYNILLRDDKSYPYIHLTLDEFPRIEFYRSKKKPNKGRYFGPFPSAGMAKETIQAMVKTFKLRTCRNSFFNSRTRPCLQYQIHRCSAPCTAYIGKQEYQQAVDKTLLFLQGKSQSVLNDLEKAMEQAVELLYYEKAAILRDQIKSLRLVQEQQAMANLQGDADVVAIEVSSGLAAIQCVTIRKGQVIGSKSFFPAVPKDSFEQELTKIGFYTKIFEAFIGFYYLENPPIIPAAIVVSHNLERIDTLEGLLTQLRQKVCKIQTSVRGNKTKWLDFATNNLKIAINQRLAAADTISQRYQALQQLLGRQNPIKHMECFDISHTQGIETVASCVVFDEKGPNKKEYRRFNISNITRSDDYAAMEQVIFRRLTRLLEKNQLPDLLIIDGGKGQVSVANKVIEQLAINHLTVLGIAKGPSRKAGFETLILNNQEIRLPPESQALHLLQQIRDEAHRFAITAHRKKRQHQSMNSSLESIEGIGPKKRRALLTRFGGIRELAKAPLDEIAKVSGINQALAERIYRHFHPT